MLVSLDGGASAFPIARLSHSSQTFVVCYFVQKSPLCPQFEGTGRSEFLSVVTPSDGGKVRYLGMCISCRCSIVFSSNSEA
jgi:hypothetical protein